ncbi:glycosyl transferases group 1 family protein [Synechococcus sp. BIOS-U3-1]|uniref:glycosyltransferase family 4 protein n=1 Tax=Synechococcus sp. BIOS-U3-1 TaxID=1400865 RepID=UPI0016472DD5|nr:glycosyltransferase [Synechococcus sp. BIOS-U3-1]QNI57152.1 glycosyl transferases group 1 family protein [Synechococcus sp. BIOS-U3-1]
MSAELDVEAEGFEHFGLHERISPHQHCIGTSHHPKSTLSWLHCNPDGASYSLTSDQRHRLRNSRYVVGTWVWESQQLPASWHQALNWIDQLWVPSGYVQDLLQHYTNKRVHVVPHLVGKPRSAGSPTKRQRQVLYIFDGHSYLHRKNPHLLLEAFAISGLPERGWKLILKTRNLGEAGGEPTILNYLRQRLIELQKLWPEQIQLLDAVLDRQSISQLLRSSAIYASPHASEGFGLTIAEAMAHGCLTAATDHGGCRDWLNTETGFPVPCQLEAIRNGYGIYKENSVWAKVEPEPLADALRQAAELHDNQPFLADEIRQAASNAIEQQCGSKAVASAIRHALSTVL